MGLFSKKRKKEEDNFDLGDKNLESPKLPELPKLKLSENSSSNLPDLPEDNEEEDESFDEINKLPSLPDNSFGEKLSQDTIKNIVSEKEKINNDFNNEEEHSSLNNSPEKTKKTDNEKPIFVKLEKFEEGMEVFKKTKAKVSEIEETLSDIKKVREEEQKQLSYWEEELQKIKNDIFVIEKNIFSKIK